MEELEHTCPHPRTVGGRLELCASVCPLGCHLCVCVWVCVCVCAHASIQRILLQEPLALRNTVRVVHRMLSGHV